MYRVITYIDGFNLYYGLRERRWQRYYWLNIQDLARNLLKPNQSLVTTKYFTSRVSSTAKNPDKSHRQKQYIEAIETLTDVQIFYGHYLEKKVACLRCGATWATHEEKMTDVNIATELMTDGF